MKILVQWATNPPADWQEIDSKDWASLPKKGEPHRDRKPVFGSKPFEVLGFEGPEERIDDKPGWVYQICVQGLAFAGDHIVVIDRSDHVEVIQWDDDPEDYPDGNYSADVWKLYDRIVDNSFKVGNGILRCQGPLQVRAMYVTKPKLEKLIADGVIPNYTSGGLVEVKDYSEFIKPDERIVRHGIWVDDRLKEEHQKAVRAISYKEWLE